MTLEQLAKLEPRARDAAVAEKVMGWKWVTPSYECDPAHRHRWLVAPEEAGFQWHARETPMHLPIDRRSLERNVPRYSADPAADYEVLRRVRKKWGGGAIDRFAQAALSVWNQRQAAGPGAWVMYAPGDYSLAALAVVTAEVPA